MTDSVSGYNNFVKTHSNWSARLIFDHISIPVTKILVRTNISPNTITFLSLAVAIIAAIFFLVPGYLLVGAIIYFVSLVLDCVDGKLARAKNLDSEAGKRLDNICDRIKKGCVFAVFLYSQFYLYGGNRWLLIGLLLIGIHYSLHIIRMRILRIIRMSGKARRTTRYSRWLTEHGLTVTLMGTFDEEFMIVVIGSLMNQVRLVLMISILLFVIFNTLDLMEYKFKDSRFKTG